MDERVAKAVTLALSYVDGLRAASAPRSESQAQAFLEHLAGQGYVVRARDGERARLKPEAQDRRRMSGADVRAMRVALDLSLARLAARAGVSQETLAHIESGRRSPQERTLKAILDALAAARAEDKNHLA